MRLSVFGTALAATVFVAGCDFGMSNKPQATNSAASQQTVQQPSFATDPQKLIVAVTGYDSATVEVTRFPVRLEVQIANSKLLGSDHSGRDAEARRIKETIVKALESSPDFATIQTIRVIYVNRDTNKSSSSRVEDIIEFHRDPTGKFPTHIT